MKKRLLSVILVLAMLLSSLAILASCEIEEEPTESGTADSTESTTEKVTETETETGTETDTETATETDTESATETDTESATETETETATETDTETATETETESATETETETATETETESATETETESATETETEPVTETETETVTETETEPVTETETEPATETETEPVTETETEPATETETEPATETETEPATETETEPATETETETGVGEYSNGEDIKDAGVVWDDEAFANTDIQVDVSLAQTKTAEEMLALLTDKEAMAEGEVYRVTEPLVLTSDTKYYGNLAAVIAEGGIIIENHEEIVIKELVVIGNITVKGSKGITFFKLDLRAEGVGISLDEASSDIAFKSCKISATDTAILSDADTVSVFQNYIKADKGIISTGDDFAVHSSELTVGSLAISSNGAYCTVKNNTINAAVDGLGVSFGDKSVNGLIALNIIRNAQTSVSVIGGYNCVVLLNSAVSIEGKGNTNLYVVENKLGGLITLENNNYLLCEANTFPKDGKNHAIAQLGNSNFNGNNLHDVDARVEHGANEELLPHTNKELFVGMTRYGQIKDISLVKKSSFSNYIRSQAKQGSIVIVPPGAYSVSPNGVYAALSLDSSHANTTIYAYGVLEEVNADEDAIYGGDVYNGMGRPLSVSGSNITIHGLTMGYDFQSSGQAYVLEKWTEVDQATKKDVLYVRVVSGAGFYKGIADSDKNVYSTGIQVAKGDMSYSYIRTLQYKFVQEDADETIVFQVTNKNMYDTLEVGDVFGCRLAGDNNQSVGLTGGNILLKDCVLYGYSASLAIVGSGPNATNVRLERVHNTSKPSPIIDKETYDKYIALEEQYGLTHDGNDPLSAGAQGLEVYIDEQGRYRGSLPRWGSVDATHITGAAQGVSATSCTFEHMVDDSSNQRGSSSRIAGVINNGETTSIYYKGSLAQVYFNINTNNNGRKTASPTNTSAFRDGDTIFAYNSDGVVLVEAAVIGNREGAGEIPAGLHIAHVDENTDCLCDICMVPMHYDYVTNGTQTLVYDCKCDVCGITVHRDYNAGVTYDGIGDGYCDHGKATCPLSGDKLVDEDGDGYNDDDGAYIIRDMTPAGKTTYDPETSILSYEMIASYNGQRYIITYTTYIYKLTVNTSDVNFDALEGFDLLDNDYFMEEKVICDNISLNSASFTFDNVLMQEYSSRGILMKTRDSVVKNCTFRSVAMTGMLLSIETTWGESSVPKNITIEGCLFDNTSHDFNNHTNRKYAPIALQGLGDLTNPDKVISEDNLPCENINIIGNKFINTNNIYVMTIYDSKDIKIKNNIIECRSLKEDDQFHTDRLTDENGNNVIDETLGRAFYIERCINVEISDNTIICGSKKLETGNHIIAYDYKNLWGNNLNDANGNRYESLPIDKEGKDTQ